MAFAVGGRECVCVGVCRGGVVYSYRGVEATEQTGRSGLFFVEGEVLVKWSLLLLILLLLKGP